MKNLELTTVLVFWQIPVHPASEMHWLLCVSVFMSYPACTPFSGKVQCEYTLCIPTHVCKAPLILVLWGIPSMWSLWWIVAWGSGPGIIWPKCSCPTKTSKKNNPHRDPRSVQQPNQEIQVTDIVKSNNMSPGHYVKCGVNTTRGSFIGE